MIQILVSIEQDADDELIEVTCDARYLVPTPREMRVSDKIAFLVQESVDDILKDTK